MTAHTHAFDAGHEQPPLPNQHFSSWLRSQTTLFISQIVAVLGIVLFLAEEVYYVSHFREQSGLLEPLTIKLIVDCAHIIFMTVFILVLIQVLDDNGRGSHRVKQVYERIFGKYQGDYDKDLKNSKEQLKNFKRHFLWFWIGMLFLYVFFACEHSYELATRRPKPAKPAAHAVAQTFSNVGESPEEQKKGFKAEVEYNTTDREESFSAQVSYDREREEESAPPGYSASERLNGLAVFEKLFFPFIVFFFNNLTQLFVFLCFLFLWIPYDEMRGEYYKYRNRSFAVVGVLTLLFPLIALIQVFKGEGHTPGEWEAFISIFDALSGVINAVALALLIARLDSKLIGLPSWLISILYSYAAVQPLFMVFSLNQSMVLEKIATSVLIFVFISKIYFFLIIIYALQTGKMLNYLLCFPVLRRLAKPDNPHAASAAQGAHAAQAYPVVEPVEADADDDAALSSESKLVQFLTRFDKRVSRLLGERVMQYVRKARTRVSLWLGEKAPLKISKGLGLVTICLFFIFLIASLFTLNNPLFHPADLKGRGNFAERLRRDFTSEEQLKEIGEQHLKKTQYLLLAREPVSLYLRHKFSADTVKQLESYDLSKSPPEELNTALVVELNKVLGDAALFDERRFEQVKLKGETRNLAAQKPRGDALLQLNRALLEETYPLELVGSVRNVIGWREVLTVVDDLLQLLFVMGMIVILYLLRKQENREGGLRALATGGRIFKMNLERKYPLQKGELQLKKFKRYFMYFWCAMFLLYVVFLLQHLDINLYANDKGVISVTSKFLQSVPDSVSPPAEGSFAHMIYVLFYPFFEVSLETLNLLFIFWCFVVLRSPAFTKRTVTRQRMMVNHSGFVLALLIALFPLLLFCIGGPELNESGMRDYATIFDGLTGTLSAIVLALLIARMDSKFFSLPLPLIGILFAYASIQPLAVAFALNDAVLKLVQMIVLFTALGLKICFFLIIAHSLQSEKALSYLVCFPFLKERVDSIFENHFEIRLARGEEDSFTLSILKKNHLYYSIERSFTSRRRCDIFVSKLRKQMKDRDAYLPPKQGTHPVSRFQEKQGTYWVELRAPGENLLCESIPLRTEKEARELIAESIEKIPYCKYTRS